jgi:hemolysin activation/secretion protein
VANRNYGVRRHPWLVVWLSLSSLMTPVVAQTADTAMPELLRQQERQRALREHRENMPDVRLHPPTQATRDRLPTSEAPCFPIQLTAHPTTGFSLSWSF